MVDMKFIACKAGVSPATVSRVLNGTKAVSPETEKKVLETVGRYHYTPNGFGRSLATGHSYMLGVVTSIRMNIFHSLLFNQVSRFAAQKGYSVVIFNTEDDFESRMHAFEMLQAQKVDALLCTFDLTEREELNAKAKLSIPLLHAGEMVDGISLYEANQKAAYEIAAYLTHLNHKRIGAVFPPLGKEESLLAVRCRGFLQALENMGCEVKREHILENVRDMSGAVQGILKIVCGKERPTAIFCYSDEVAIGAMFSLIQNGFRIPEDISIIGFDGIPIGAMLTPKLTTIAQDIEYVAERSVDKMISMAEGKKSEMVEEKVEYGRLFRLDIGGSCCPPQDSLHMKYGKAYG